MKELLAACNLMQSVNEKLPTMDNQPTVIPNIQSSSLELATDRDLGQTDPTALTEGAVGGQAVLSSEGFLWK